MADEERLATKSKSSEDDNKISELLNSAKALQNTKLDLSRKSLHDIPHQTYDLSRLEVKYDTEFPMGNRTRLSWPNFRDLELGPGLQ